MLFVGKHLILKVKMDGSIGPIGLVLLKNVFNSLNKVFT